MSRIAHKTFLQAYDALASAVSAQSKDARFSPAEVEKAQAKAKSEGRQDVAQLIGKGFEELRASEFKGGTVTKSDVTAGRAQLAALLDTADGAARCDGRNNGLSNAEIGTLNPIIDLLLQMSELSSVLSTSKPGRESKTYLTKALDYAGDILKAAAGNNRLTGAEVGAALKGVDANVAYLARSLYATAKNTEKASGHVGSGDIDRAIGIHTAYINRRDKGAAGFDNAELANLPPMYATAYNVGRAIEAKLLD